MSSVEETGVNQVIDALREVTHLDAVQGIFVAHRLAGELAPDLKQYIAILLTEERGRRKSEEDKTDYTVVDFRFLPSSRLLGMAGFAKGAAACCAMTEPRVPTLIQFASAIQEMLLKCIAFKMLAVERELASMRSQNN